MNIVNSGIEFYLKSLRDERENFFYDMEMRAEKDGFPIIGPDVGKFLYLLTKISNSEKILELGSGFGYSACFFAKALGGNGKIVCTDMDQSNKVFAENIFKTANFKCRIDFIVGDALKIAEDMNESFDIVYNDIDKEFYPETIELAYKRLNSGGLFITDNSLWGGRVVKSAKEQDIPTLAVSKFNLMLKEDLRFETSFIPIRDGIAIAVKK